MTPEVRRCSFLRISPHRRPPPAASATHPCTIRGARDDGSKGCGRVSAEPALRRIGCGSPAIRTPWSAGVEARSRASRRPRNVLAPAPEPLGSPGLEALSSPASGCPCARRRMPTCPSSSAGTGQERTPCPLRDASTAQFVDCAMQFVDCAIRLHRLAGSLVPARRSVGRSAGRSVRRSGQRSDQRRPRSAGRRSSLSRSGGTCSFRDRAYGGYSPCTVTRTSGSVGCRGSNVGG